MKVTPEHDERVAKLTFASVYPHYIAKVERKGRTKRRVASGNKMVNRF